MAEHNQRFDSFEEWVNHASSWLTRHPLYNDGKDGHSVFRAVCFDDAGCVCSIGKDFMRARDLGRFPIRWVWPDQVPALHKQVDVLSKDLLTIAEMSMSASFFQSDSRTNHARTSRAAWGFDDK